MVDKAMTQIQHSPELPEPVGHLVMELMRRIHILVDAVGSNWVNSQILTVLVLDRGEPHSVTVLVNETGVARSTLLRHLKDMERRGVVVQTSVGKNTYYAVTPSAAELCLNFFPEMINIARGRQIGFSRALLAQLEEAALQLKPSAKTISFPALSRRAQNGHISG